MASFNPTPTPAPAPSPSPNPNPNPNDLTLTKASGGFLWEVYKPTADGEATATATAQAICNAVLPGNARCSGKFPGLAPRPAVARTNRLVESVVELRSAA